LGLSRVVNGGGMIDKFKDLHGHTIAKIEGGKGDNRLIFTLSNGEQYELYHEQDCCESVTVEDICGDIQDLINLPLYQAEEVSSKENPPNTDPNFIEWQDSFTWTFYKLATIKGSVTVRWYGESNGYYSEEVSFRRIW
jgi:hypothetical protein